VIVLLQELVLALHRFVRDELRIQFLFLPPFLLRHVMKSFQILLLFLQPATHRSMSTHCNTTLCLAHTSLCQHTATLLYAWLTPLYVNTLQHYSMLGTHRSMSTHCNTTLCLAHTTLCQHTATLLYAWLTPLYVNTLQHNSMLGSHHSTHLYIIMLGFHSPTQLSHLNNYIIHR